MLAVNYRDLHSVALQYAEKYQANPPFPNIYLDNFFDPTFLEQILLEFPDVEKLTDKLAYTNPNEKKLAAKGENKFGLNTRKLVHFLNSEPFLNFLQILTGIKETLIPDPYFVGGGFHEIKPGGFLKLHVDFHRHQKMELDRRLNLLVYLNKNWEESFGGHFELWERDMSKSVTKILPIFNRIALFTTSGDSWHGHPDPLNCPEGMSRKSLALYYYTNGRPESELSKRDFKRITTTFAARKGQDNSKMKRYNSVVNTLNTILPRPAINFIKSLRKK